MGYTLQCKVWCIAMQPVQDSSRTRRAAANLSSCEWHDTLQQLSPAVQGSTADGGLIVNVTSMLFGSATYMSMLTFSQFEITGMHGQSNCTCPEAPPKTSAPVGAVDSAECPGTHVRCRLSTSGPSFTLRSCRPPSPVMLSGSLHSLGQVDKLIAFRLVKLSMSSGSSTS